MYQLIVTDYSYCCCRKETSSGGMDAEPSHRQWLPRPQERDREGVEVGAN